MKLCIRSKYRLFRRRHLRDFVSIWRSHFTVLLCACRSENKKLFIIIYMWVWKRELGKSSREKNHWKLLEVDNCNWLSHKRKIAAETNWNTMTVDIFSHIIQFQWREQREKWTSFHFTKDFWLFNPFQY